MDASRTYDVVIIGSGAGGGTLLHELAPTGKKILVLERGGYLPREKDNWSSRAVFIDNKYKARETWLDKDRKPFHPEIHYCVGGNTKLYGAALLRFDPKDFDELRHHGGISPAWPISYRDMEPFYEQAERLYHVHSDNGPYPPLKHEPRIQALHEDLQKLGYSPAHLPMGIMLDEEEPEKSPCIRCDTCDGYPCLLGGKADAEVCCVRPSLRYPNVTFLTNARVVRLDTSASGREVNRVIARYAGGLEEFRGDIVIAACGAINSAALLLCSANAAHPNGLANSSDQVGRNYMCHNNSAFVAFSPSLNPTRFEKTLCLNEFYLGSEDFGFPLGAIQTMGKADAEKFEAAAPFPAPHFLLDRMGRHSLDFWVTSEDLPRPENRVIVEDGGAIVLQYTPNNLEPHGRLNAKLASILRQVDALHRRGVPMSVSMRKKVPVRGTTHQCGTVRFGRDPRSSVLDENCKAHDLDNLYVVDSGFMPSSAAMNPALTIAANALRVAAHLEQRLH